MIKHVAGDQRGRGGSSSRSSVSHPKTSICLQSHRNNTAPGGWGGGIPTAARIKLAEIMSLLHHHWSFKLKACCDRAERCAFLATLSHTVHMHPHSDLKVRISEADVPSGTLRLSCLCFFFLIITKLNSPRQQLDKMASSKFCPQLWQLRRADVESCRRAVQAPAYIWNWITLEKLKNN